MLDNTPNRPKRLLHMDLLRLLAIYFVIFNHTGPRGYTLFTNSMDSVMYIPYMLFSILCKVAVPIFFMISGALLLPKQESLGRLFSKRILRMVIVLILISVPYYYWVHRAHGIGLTDFLTFIFGNSATTSLWYLYSYVALLLMMPFLRSMVKAMAEKDFLYLIAGYLVVFGVIPCLELCLWKGNVSIHQSFTPVLFLTPNVFYALVGYYLEHIMDYQKNRKRILGIGVCFSVIALLVTCMVTHYQKMVVGECTVEQWERFFNCFICIPAMTLYYAAKCASEKLQGVRQQKVLPVLGGAVFGVYLIEKLLRVLMEFVYVHTAPLVGSFLASLTWTLAVFCLGLFIVVLMKHTPGLKKIVNIFI